MKEYFFQHEESSKRNREAGQTYHIASGTLKLYSRFGAAADSVAWLVGTHISEQKKKLGGGCDGRQDWTGFVNQFFTFKERGTYLANEQHRWKGVLMTDTCSPIDHLWIASLLWGREMVCPLHFAFGGYDRITPPPLDPTLGRGCDYDFLAPWWFPTTPKSVTCIMHYNWLTIARSIL